MSYDKQTWTNGEIITADKMNHMENGIEEAGDGSGDVFYINLTLDFPDTQPVISQCDATYTNILNAYNNHLPIIVIIHMDEEPDIISICTYIQPLFFVSKPTLALGWTVTSAVTDEFTIANDGEMSIERIMLQSQPL